MPSLEEALSSSHWSVVHLHTAVALRRKVGPALHALGSVADPEEGVGWDGPIRRLLELVNDLDFSGDQCEVGVCLDAIRSGIATYGATYRASNGGLHDWCTRLADELEEIRVEDVATELVLSNERGHALLNECVERWGSDESIARARALEVAPVGFERAPGTQLALKAHCDAPDRITVVRQEGRNLLLSVLSLDFYFLHEYLSHLYPLWDDPEGALSDGYLMDLATRAYRRAAPTPIDADLITLDFAAHSPWRRNRLSASDYELIQSGAAWMRERCPDTFARRLLDLATYEDPNHDGLNRKWVLYSLQWVTQNASPAVVEEVICDADLTFEAFVGALRKRILGELPPTVGPGRGRRPAPTRFPSSSSDKLS